MPACNYFYLIDSAISPLRFRITILHDAGVIADPCFNDLIRYIDTISESINFYSRAVEKGLREL